MQRTISMMMGKGSVRHNSRQFHAKNTDPERAYLNRDYCNEKIKDVYHELFDEALETYNAKQTRADRRIDNYYKKICSGKQEKPFHEIILQIGNKDDMSAQTDDGALAAKVLDEYMLDFQARNPSLRVFSAHLHMDEATPHLHIDFIPFITGSKRGLKTRVSLKQALAAQGFLGGSRGDTEWSQWAASEKQELAAVMERHGIEWEQKGTHEKHLSVLDYEKKMRTEEVAELDSAIAERQTEISEASEALERMQTQLSKIQGKKELIEDEIADYKKSKWSLPEPPVLMSAKAYHEDYAIPLVKKLKAALRSAVARYHKLVLQIDKLRDALTKAENEVKCLTDLVRNERAIHKESDARAQDYRLIRKFLGEEKTDGILEQARALHPMRKPDRAREVLAK